MDRRAFMTVFSCLGLSSTLLPGALAAVAGQSETITTEMMAQAEKIAGLEFTERQRREVVDGLNRSRAVFHQLRALEMANHVPLPLEFNPLPQSEGLPVQEPLSAFEPGPEERPEHLEDAAFWPVTRLAGLLKHGRVSSTELTRMYLARLKKYDPLLKCVVTLTKDLALEQAARADAELAAGKWRGPLHGIPWGVKDLFATQGIPTSWGMERYRNRILDYNATVVSRLEQAGAVLVAKLSMGELATGDRWFGGRTRNPWNPARGSGGSSAGSASAVAAGLVGFALGTETNGSLIGPAMICGVNGLRPTFGRVSRHGAMTIAWSYDKVGPMCRAAGDCGLVLAAISGPDDLDHSVADLKYGRRAPADFRQLRVGYIKGLFDLAPDNPWMADILAAHRRAFEKMQAMGLRMVEIDDAELADIIRLTKVAGLGMMVEAAAAHDQLGLEPEPGAFRHTNWAKRFRWARYVPAVDFIQANRARSLLMDKVNRIMDRVDIVLGRMVTSGLLSNLTGQPELSIPHGPGRNRLPVAVILAGRLFGEADMITLAKAYQNRTDYHLVHPGLDGRGNSTGPA